MKMLISALLALTLITSCDFWKDAKTKVAEAAGEGVQKLVEKELARHSECSESDRVAESRKLGDEVEERLLKVLKVDESKKKSVAGDVLRIACKAALKNVLPSVLRVSVSKYPCSASYFGTQSARLADPVCEGIKL